MGRALRCAPWLLVGLAACAGFAQVHERPWLLVCSPHFEIWSALDAQDSRDLARDLEFSRAFVERTTGARLEPRIPTRIYTFSDHATLIRFSPVRWAVGSLYVESTAAGVPPGEAEELETYAMYGSTFLLDGEDAARGLETLEHAQRLLPSNLEIKLLLARLYARLDRREASRELALTVLGWGHDPETQQAARDLLAELEAAGPPESTRR